MQTFSASLESTMPETGGLLAYFQNLLNDFHKNFVVIGSEDSKFVRFFDEMSQIHTGTSP